MLGILAAAAGAVVGAVVGGGASVVSSLIRGDGLPSWSEFFGGVKKGALIGGLGVGGVLLAAAVLGVALPTLGAGLVAGLLASTLYSLFTKHRLPSLEMLGAGAVGGVLAGGVLALALGAATFVGLGGVASTIAAPVAAVAGTVVGGTVAKEELEYEKAMEDEKKLPATEEIVVPGDITKDPLPASTNSSPSQTRGMSNALTTR